MTYFSYALYLMLQTLYILPKQVLWKLMMALLILSCCYSQTAEFCWKNTKTRGVGSIPSQCSDSQDKIGLLCYEKCPDNYKRFGFDCHSVCPQGGDWRDDGLFCRMKEYGRGAGYPWRGSDGFSDKGMRKRCQNDHGKGKCQKYGAIYYPKCKSGFDNAGCCLCRPNTPDCAAHGLGGRIDLSCAKKIKIGNPQPMECPSDKEYDAGLCYNKCPSGYTGIGPVCWANNPNGWVGCGMGAAKSSIQCGLVVFDQVTSVGALALNIATAGAASSAKKAAQQGKDTAKLDKLRKQLDTLKDLYHTTGDVADIISLTISTRQAGSTAGDDASQIETVDSTKVTIEDIVRITAAILAILDPTGVADIVASYTYPTCDKITV